MKNIIISILICFPIFIFGQYTIKGQILNEDGDGLYAASVFILDKNLATTSDEKGFFRLENVSVGKHLLQANYVGFESFKQEVEITDSMSLDIVLKGKIYGIDQIEIRANRLNDLDAPFTYQNIDKEEIQKTNLGQDIPQLLQYTPSIVATSDAGAGIGYTGMRIRGSDPTRINVTINGVPLNDSESQGVFWVNLPDLASATENIQIQRGVGTSTSGAGAFGATIDINTHKINHNPYVQIDGSYGSFDTRKYTVQLGTGLMNDHYAIDFRYSKINSDGYIDRSSSDLDAWQFSAANINDKGSLRLNISSGHEITYQSWYGSPEAKVNEDMDALRKHYQNNLGSYPTTADSLNLFDSDRKYNYYTYEDQVDNYRQTHAQLHFARTLSDATTLNATAHYTKGKGFFEEFKYKEDIRDYGFDLPVDNGGVPIDSIGNIIRKRWLDNDFYGLLLNLNQEITANTSLTLGTGINRYTGGHFGQVRENEIVPAIDVERRYYENNSTKNDVNFFAKLNHSFGQKLDVFGDLQFRTVSYSALGVDNDSRNIDIDTSLYFFNPKLGLKYLISDNSNLYLSYSVGNREPVRNDYIDAVNDAPKHETLRDLELGFRHTTYRSNYEIVLYAMDYTNQLVLTGELNDVGSSVRTNVDKSSRLGIELAADFAISNKLRWSPNLTFSQNKIAEFTEVLEDYTTGFDIVKNQYTDTDISFSPNIIGASRLLFNATSALSVELMTKYVGKQFLDNTSNDQRALDSYLVNDFRLGYNFNLKGIKKLQLNLLINNILNERYASNGYTFSYIFEEMITENFLYPQAERNFLIGITARF